jgi:hypothetical protein
MSPTGGMATRLYGRLASEGFARFMFGWTGAAHKEGNVSQNLGKIRKSSQRRIFGAAAHGRNGGTAGKLCDACLPLPSAL